MPGDLDVLVSSPNPEMIPSTAHARIDFKNAGVECILDAYRCVRHAGKHDRVQDP